MRISVFTLLFCLVSQAFARHPHNLFGKNRRSDQPIPATQSMPAYVGKVDKDGWTIILNENDCVFRQKDDKLVLKFGTTTITAGSMNLYGYELKPDFDLLTLRSNVICVLASCQPQCVRGMNISYCRVAD